MIEEQPRQQAQDQTGQQKVGWLKNRNMDREKIKYVQRTHSMKVKRVVVGSMSMVDVAHAVVSGPSAWTAQQVVL
jgi:hypothetical protein